MPRLVVDGDDVEVETNDGESILAALYRCGYAYRIGCRRGGCGICKVDLVDGEVDYPKVVAEQVLSAQERTSGSCLSCRAVPTGDVVIRLRDEHLRRGAASLLALYQRPARRAGAPGGAATTGAPGPR